MTVLLSLLLSAVQRLPNSCYVRSEIMRKKSMSICQKIIAAVYSITNKEDYGFYVAEEPALIERIIEAAELPFNSESYAEVKSRLSTSVMATALKEIGVEITRNERHPEFMTVWGPGVRRG